MVNLGERELEEARGQPHHALSSVFPSRPSDLVQSSRDENTFFYQHMPGLIESVHLALIHDNG